MDWDEILTDENGDPLTTETGEQIATEAAQAVPIPFFVPAQGMMFGVPI